MLLTFPPWGDDWWYYSVNVTIFASIFIVIYIFSHCVTTIARMPNPLWRTARNDAMEVHKKPVKFCYRLKLKEDSVQTPNSVTFHLKTSRPAEIKLFWNVSVPYIFEFMNSSWSDFQLALSDPATSFASHRARGYLDPCCHSIIDCPVPQSDSDNDDDGSFDGVISVTPPDSLNWADMKNKYRYPLVIVVYNPNISDDERTHGPPGDSGNDIHGLFAIFHVKSDLFPQPTTILSTYIKMDNGSTFLLKPLYLVDDDVLPTSEEDDNESERLNQNAPLSSSSPASAQDHQNEDSFSAQDVESRLDSFPNVLCSVCQTLRSSRALLPCGHVCLCNFCFPRVDKCPICRAEIQHYFKICSENYRRNEEDIHEAPRYHRSWFDAFEDFNDRLNNWLGFHE